MAEQEVIKHTKAVYNVWKDPHTSWQHKLKEILIEIAIIVFAITLSLWLHNWSEHNHEQTAEKTFLNGLKNDLQKDLVEMQEDRDTYLKAQKAMKYFYNVSYGEQLSMDSLGAYDNLLFNSTQLTPNISRFEGLKASGKIDIIENKDLQKDILELYQEQIPFLIRTNDIYNTFKTERLAMYLDRSLVLKKDGTGNWEQVFRMPEVQNSLRRTAAIDEIIDLYNRLIEKNKKIIKEINEEYQ